MAAKPKFDKQAVKDAARGRWGEILANVGIGSEFLTGSHGPCPKCGGTDRWRVFDDFASTGGAICNQCGLGLSDGFSVLGWYISVDFVEALARVAQHVGIEPQSATTAGKSGKPAKKSTSKGKPKKKRRRYDSLFDAALAIYAGLIRDAKSPARQVTGWMYHDAAGAERFAVIRFETSEGKTYRPLCSDGQSWMIGDPADTEIPLYNLQAIAAADVVYLVEGERCAVVAGEIGFTATTSAHGSKSPHLTDWSPLAGKRVIALPDSDAPGERYVCDVARILTSLSEPAIVTIRRLPGLGESGDIVDYVLAGRSNNRTLDELRAEIESLPDEIPTIPEDRDPEPEDPGTVKLVADQITLTASFAQDSGGRLYHYRDGTYRPRAEEFIKRQVKRQVHTLDITNKWSSRLGNEVCEYLRIDADHLWERPPLDVVNVQNGLLTIATGELKPHSPEFLSPVQLPVSYDPRAICPKWEKFVAETFPADGLCLAWEIVAWLMVPDTSIQKAVLLTGEGANGKSRYLAGVQAFLGNENVCGLSLHRLESDRFCVARMIGRLANICPDLPSEHLASTSTFKAITGGDSLVAEYKFRDTFEIRPFARLVFSANHPPQSQDGSHGFFRRWIVVPFTRTFSDAEQIDSTQLDAMLADPAELSGLLNKAIEARVTLNRQRGLSQPQSVTEAGSEFRAVTDPLAVWLERNTIEDPHAQVAKASLHAAYNDASSKAGRPAMSINAFGRAINRLKPGIVSAQRTIGGKLAWAYVGLGLTSSRDSLDSSYLFLTRESGSREEQRAEKQEEQNPENSIQIRGNRVNHVNKTTDPRPCSRCASHLFNDHPISDKRLRRDCAGCGHTLEIRDAEAVA